MSIQGPRDQVFTDGAGHTAEQNLVAGERNPSSSTEGYLDVRSATNAVLLDDTSANAIGGSSAADDTFLMGVLIEANATTAATATIAGFEDSGGLAANMVLTGNILATDARVVEHTFGSKGILNSAGTLSITASAANKVWVLWRSA